jgi:hypothetical protein
VTSATLVLRAMAHHGRPGSCPLLPSPSVTFRAIRLSRSAASALTTVMPESLVASDLDLVGIESAVVADFDAARRVLGDQAEREGHSTSTAETHTTARDGDAADRCRHTTWNRDDWQCRVGGGERHEIVAATLNAHVATDYESHEISIPDNS